MNKKHYLGFALLIALLLATPQIIQEKEEIKENRADFKLIKIEYDDIITTSVYLMNNGSVRCNDFRYQTRSSEKNNESLERFEFVEPGEIIKIEITWPKSLVNDTLYIAGEYQIDETEYHFHIHYRIWPNGQYETETRHFIQLS